MAFDRHRATLAGIASFLLTLLLFQAFANPQIWQGSYSWTTQQSAEDPTLAVRELLAPHLGAGHFKFTRKHIRVRQGARPDNRSLPALDTAFDPYFVATADLSQASMFETLRQLGEPQTLNLELPSPQYREHPVRLMFALATDVQHLSDNLEHMQFWMRQKGVSIFALVPPDERALELQAAWQKFGVDITIEQLDVSFFDGLLALIPKMHALAESKYKGNIEWFTILDDDTFIPSVSRFASTLAAYDHERPFYIGGMSEPKADLSGIGYFAYGGAGMVFSKGLVEELSPQMPECIKTASVEWGGDGRLAECVTRYTQTRLTYLRDLHQMDIVGDQSGIYESGFKPLTLHHWRGWTNTSVPMPKVAQVAALTGGRGLFQRFRFSDGYVLTNGFSLVKYQALAEQSTNPEAGGTVAASENTGAIDFTKTEFTWANGQMWEFDHSLGPFRPKHLPAEKKSWYFVDSIAEGQEGAGPVRQLYLAKGEKHQLPEAVELIWTQ
ncbi:MAG: hypothetical protein Q9159_004773 [Coniocarpon cinnabarinum]